MTRIPRDPFALAAIGLAAVAFAGSFDHTHATVIERGQTGWVAVATALMPEVSVALSVLRIRRGGRAAQVRWAWLVLVTSAGFTIWANLEQAQPTLGGLVVGGWPAWAAIGAAGFIEMAGPTRARPAAARPAAPRATHTPASAVPVSSPAAARPVAVEPQPLALVPAQDAGADDGGRREAAKVHARVVLGETGALPAQKDLIDAGFSPSTAKRALRELRAEVAA